MYIIIDINSFSRRCTGDTMAGRGRYQNTASKPSQFVEESHYISMDRRHKRAYQNNNDNNNVAITPGCSLNHRHGVVGNASRMRRSYSTPCPVST